MPPPADGGGPVEQSTGHEAGSEPWWPSAYGPEDQIGMLNEISAADIVQAARLVRQGRIFDLSHTLDENVPAFPGRASSSSTMT